MKKRIRLYSTAHNPIDRDVGAWPFETSNESPPLVFYAGVLYSRTDAWDDDDSDGGRRRTYQQVPDVTVK